MSSTKTKVSNEEIETFLQGSNPEKYIVAIESNYSEPTVTLVINDPEKGKYLYDDTYKPFLWFKEEVTSMIYGGKRLKIMQACRDYGIKITKLNTSSEDGYTPQRMEDGYKYMATCKHSYNNLLKFFKEGGIDVFSDKHIDPNNDKSPMYRSFFVMFSPTEQYLIQSGKRLFNGMDDYDDVHRFQFDLETEGLFASKNAIFQIGVRDNKGLEGVLETIGSTSVDKRNSERENIEKFFKIIDAVQPDIITGYNSENFDWPFLFERAERLSIPITELAITLNRLSKIKRKDSSLKLGGETEKYKQTHMFGYNIMDISHAVRRAMAINSEIKSWGLKYITQYSEIAKPNRVYVPGDKINTTWADKVNQYAFNNTDGDWYMITDKKPLKDGYRIVKGDYIVQRYLCDDLWETEQIDNIFNQASFLIAKMLPTTFMRSSTMGTAGQWKLIMAAWSYERGLAIPAGLPKRDFTGGLSRLLEVGYARGVVKLDFAALYPKIQLTHLIFPDLDISGVMEGMLTYVVDTRDKFKFLTGTEKKKAKKLEAKLKESKDLTPEEIASIKKQISEHKALANIYDKKQLRSGAYGSRMKKWKPLTMKYDTKTTKTYEGKPSGITIAGTSLPKFPDYSGKITRINTTNVDIAQRFSPGDSVKSQFKSIQKENIIVDDVINQSARLNQMILKEIVVTTDGDLGVSAGDIVFCDFRENSVKKNTEVSKKTGGKYMVSGLCHLFIPSNTYTKMSLVRDSDGRVV